jgi:hypothetical protein
MTRLDSEAESRLIETAKDLVPGLIEYIVSYGAELKQRARCVVSDDKEADIKLDNELFYEAFYIVLHLLDCLIILTLGSYKRSIFMDTIYQTINDGLLVKGALKEDIIEEFNKCQDEYSKFKLFPAKGENSFKDTIHWEFGKKIVSKYGDGNPATILVISSGVLLTVQVLQEILESLKLDSFT